MGASRSSTAPGGPGAVSYFDLSRKDCLGTARNTTSRVWFTVAGGMLSDVYYPTLDNTNVQTLQYIVTDGRTFTDIQARDAAYTVRALNARALDCQVVMTARSGRYRIVTDYLTDPRHNTVEMHVRFVELARRRVRYRLYVRFDPSINGNGGGFANIGGDTGAVVRMPGRQIPVAYDRNIQAGANNRTYAGPVYAALDSSYPFIQVSNGFAGSPSDGLIQLTRAHRLTALYAGAVDGNLVQTVQVGLAHPTFDLTLGFGHTSLEAVAAAAATLHEGFDGIRQRYEAGWHAYDHQLHRPPTSEKGIASNEWRRLVDEYYLSANVLKASEDKRFSGAIVASMTAPWGQAVPADVPFYAGYREVWARDLYEAWTGLMADGDRRTAGQALAFLFFRQQASDGSFPRNSLISGQASPDGSGLQLDECAYPLIMAAQLGWHGRHFYERHIRPEADFIIGAGPVAGVERWEEQTGYSPSTISAEIAGLLAAAGIASVNHDYRDATVWRAVADGWQRSIERWTVTTNGPLAHHPYFIRVSKTGDPNAAIAYNLGNGGPSLDQRAVVDQGFLELVRLGLLAPGDRTVRQSLRVIDKMIERTTASGSGWRRYNGDGYGDQAKTGTPWVDGFVGTGHVWPVLTGERAEYELASGNRARSIVLLNTMRRFGSGVGLIPEQDWDMKSVAASPYAADPISASIGFRNGHPAGSAAPLTWAEGQYVRLFEGILQGRLVDRPADTVYRYILHRHPRAALVVTRPADQATVGSARVWIKGRSHPGDAIYVAATTSGTDSPTIVRSGRADKRGRFALAVRLSTGPTTLNIVATGRFGATALVQRTIFFQ